MDQREFKTARKRLGLTLAEAAHIMGVDSRTVRRWEADPETTKNARAPAPTAVRVMHWMLDGFRPPEFPDKADHSSPSSSDGADE